MAASDESEHSERRKTRERRVLAHVAHKRQTKGKINDIERQNRGNGIHEHKARYRHSPRDINERLTTSRNRIAGTKYMNRKEVTGTIRET